MRPVRGLYARNSGLNSCVRDPPYTNVDEVHVMSLKQKEEKRSYGAMKLISLPQRDI